LNHYNSRKWDFIFSKKLFNSDVTSSFLHSQLNKYWNSRNNDFWNKKKKKKKKKKKHRLHILGTHLPIWPYSYWLTVRWWVIGILYQLRRSQSSLHTARRCIPNVPTYISNDHEHQNGIINFSLVGVIIGDWKFYNHQGLCLNSKRSIKVGWNNHLRVFEIRIETLLWIHLYSHLILMFLYIIIIFILKYK